MATIAMAWTACLLALLFRARAQVHILSPISLVHHVSATIEGSTATFGAPFYGDRVLGVLQYGESKKTHCEDDYLIPKEGGRTDNKGGVELINIIVVKRGNCSFTTKVIVAKGKGAHAVIIVDTKESNLMDLRSIIVADDGRGGDIKIPSVLISYKEGTKLIEAVKMWEQQVIVELAWKAPADHTVQTDLWMSSASRESQRFLKDFAKKRRALNRLVSFTPHYAVFSITHVDVSTAGNLCIDQQGELCGEDPDGAHKVTGKMVLEEDVRQLCIHETYKVQTSTSSNRPAVEYSKEFWDYIERFPDRCPLDRFGLDCSESLMAEVGIDKGLIQTCVKAEGDNHAKLVWERDHPAWSPRALRINGWRYSGTMDADLVTRAICSGFIELPKECTEIITKRDSAKRDLTKTFDSLASRRPQPPATPGASVTSDVIEVLGPNAKQLSPRAIAGGAVLFAAVCSGVAMGAVCHACLARSQVREPLLAGSAADGEARMPRRDREMEPMPAGPGSC